MPQVFEAAVSVVLLLLGFAAVLFAAYWCTNLLGKRYEAGLSPLGYIRVLDRVNIGPDRQVCIVQTGGKTFLLGVTSQSVVTLGELDAESLAQVQPNTQTAVFPDILQSFLKKSNSENTGKEAEK